MSTIEPKKQEMHQMSFNDLVSIKEEVYVNNDIMNNDNDDYILLENGNVYTYLYHKSAREHMTKKLEELVVINFDIRNAIIPEEIDMCCGLITRDDDFGVHFGSEVKVPRNVHMSVALEKDYKDLQLKMKDLLEKSRNENPSILIIDEIRNMKLLSMISHVAKEYNIAIIVTITISDKLNDLINECHKNEVPIMVIMAAGKWANDKIFNKLKHAFSVSDVVMLTVPFRDGFVNRLLFKE